MTPGGGGDGALLVDATLSAYERFNGRLPWPALVVYGPFLPARDRAAFERRAARLARVTTLEFHEHLENLVEKAAAVVCLGGYNTFCEVLSLKKRSLIVPRVTPRAEQLLRAQAATRLGLAQTLDPSRLTPETLAEAIIHLPEQSPPATHRVPGLLDGLRFINQAVAKWRVEGPPRPGSRGAGAPPRPARPRPASRLSPSPAAARMRPSIAPPLVVVVLKGYPRVSETFIAHELAALERHGLPLHIVSLAGPYDRLTHPVHGTIRAAVTYLPEYLHEAPGRVLAATPGRSRARRAATSARSASGSATSCVTPPRTAAGASVRPASSRPSCRPAPPTSTPTSSTRRPPSPATRRR